MLQTTSTGDVAAGEDRPRSGGSVKMHPMDEDGLNSIVLDCGPCAFLWPSNGGFKLNGWLERNR